MPKITKSHSLLFFRLGVREELKTYGTQRKLANACGMSYVHLSRILTGLAQPSWAMTETISSTLKVDLADLISMGKVVYYRKPKKKARK